MKKIGLFLTFCSSLLIAGCSNGGQTTNELANNQIFDFYPLEDGTYAVGVGKLIYQSKITIPDSYNGKSVTKIARFGFKDYQNLRTIEIPSSITEIDDYAFEYCEALTDIQLPSSLERINRDAFDSCNIGALVVPASVISIGDYAFGNSKITSLTFAKNSKLEIVGRDMLHFSKELTKLVLPEGVTNLPEGFCEECLSLTSVTLPSSIMNIDRQAFRSCDSLKTITYKGTKDEWNSISKHKWWNEDSNLLTTIKCSDGSISLK